MFRFHKAPIGRDFEHNGYIFGFSRFCSKSEFSKRLGFVERQKSRQPGIAFLHPIQTNGSKLSQSQARAQHEKNLIGICISQFIRGWNVNTRHKYYQRFEIRQLHIRTCCTGIVRGRQRKLSSKSSAQSSTIWLVPKHLVIIYIKYFCSQFNDPWAMETIPASSRLDDSCYETTLFLSLDVSLSIERSECNVKNLFTAITSRNSQVWLEVLLDKH